MVEGFFFFLLGLLFGSFANVLIYRIPHGISIILPSSFCPECKKKIKFYDNVPLLSYLILKGKCRYCGKKIPIRYPLVELLSGFIFYTSYLKFGISIKMLGTIFLLYFLMIMAFIDYETGYIYDSILFPSIYAGFIISFFQNHLLSSIFYALFAFLFGFFIGWMGKKIFKKEALGEGDPYVFALIAIYIRGFDFFLTLFISFFIGSIIGILFLLKNKKEYLPLLPFLFSGTFIYYLIYPYHLKILLGFIIK